MVAEIHGRLDDGNHSAGGLRARHNPFSGGPHDRYFTSQPQANAIVGAPGTSKSEVKPS